MKQRLVLLGLLVVLSGCGASEQQQVGDLIDQIQARQRAAVANEVKLGRLPPITMEMFDANNQIQPDFIEGSAPLGQDIVRTRDHGLAGPPLRWDFNGDGRFEASERRFTEEDLYHQAHHYIPPTETIIASIKAGQK